MQELVDLTRAVGRIEGKLDLHLERVQAIADEADCLEKRVRSLEGWRWYVLGAVGAAGILASVAFAFI